MRRWWNRLEEQHYWFELTERPYSDLGKNLKAPKTNLANKEYWGYSILKEIREDDLVIHYHKKDKAIVAISQASKPWVSGMIDWTPSKKKKLKTKLKPSFEVGLKNFKKIKPVTLEQIRKKNDELETILNDLTLKYDAAYSPFKPKTSKRSLSVNEGYGFVVTQEFVNLFPSLVNAFESNYISKDKEQKSLKDPKSFLDKKKKKVSSARNEAIELRAVEIAENYLIKQKYTVERMPRKNFPYDLKAIKNGAELHVEVKGKGDNGEKVILSRNEKKYSQANPQNSAFILVHSIKTSLRGKRYKASGGKIFFQIPWLLKEEDLDPYTYEYYIKK